MTEAYHPNVNEQNHRVQKMPQRFQEGDVVSRWDNWAEAETSHWVVRDVEAVGADTTACGFRYRIEEQGGDAAKFITHGELQLLAARNQLRWF